MKLIIADSGPLIALASTGHVETLCQIAGAVLVPETVYRECTVDEAKPGARGIVKAAQSAVIERITDPDLGVFADMRDLDAGEAFALALAAPMKATVLMDDAVGREIAKAHGIPVVGGCGILVMAKQRGLIAEVAPILRAWQEGLGYFLSDALVASVLARAGEGSA